MKYSYFKEIKTFSKCFNSSKDTNKISHKLFSDNLESSPLTHFQWCYKQINVPINYYLSGNETKNKNRWWYKSKDML